MPYVMTIFIIVVGLLLIIQGILGIGGAKTIGRIPFITGGVVLILEPFVARRIANWIFVVTIVAIVAASIILQYWVERRSKQKSEG